MNKRTKISRKMEMKKSCVAFADAVGIAGKTSVKVGFGLLTVGLAAAVVADILDHSIKSDKRKINKK
jgi:hypothetical protein